MTRQHFFWTSFLILTVLAIIFAFRFVNDKSCDCDKAQTEKTIKSKDFSRLAKSYDTLTDKNFYNLSLEDNRELWYRDVQSPEKTKFTSLWNDYARNNYHASHLDFVKYFQEKQEIELAFQLGPNDDLWAYFIFVVKKVDCCYLITRNYFRHARFTGKRYAILDKPQLDSLFAVVSELKVSKIDTAETFEYCGYFRDNRNHKSFYINFEKDQLWVANKQDTTQKDSELRPETKRFFNFIDEKIKWEKTYSL